MNRFYSISSLFLSVLFMACQSDEPVIDNGGKSDGENIGYIAVNIVQPNSVGGRADGTSSTDFEYGSDDENKADRALFFLFDSNGNVFEDMGTPYIDVSLKPQANPATGNSPEVERIYNTVLIIDGQKSDPSQNVKKIVCVLNAPDALKRLDDKKITKLSELKEMIGQYDGCTAGSFIMTNSVYTKDGKIATSAEEMVKKSESEARNNPVNIYVERVVAKVEAAFKQEGTGTEGFKNDGAKPFIDGEETPLGITITGIEVANIAGKSYLFKSVAGAENAAEGSAWKLSNVFDENNKRSYWETVPSIGTETGMALNNQSYETIVNNSKLSTPSTTAEEGTGAESSKLLGSIVSGYTGNNKYKTYVQPNTTEEATQKTCILVTAQLTKDGKPCDDLAYIRGGYTTIDAAKNVVARYLAAKGWYKKNADGTITSIVKEDLVWKNRYDFDPSKEKTAYDELAWLKDYEVVAQLKDKNLNVCNSDGTTFTSAEAVDTHLRGSNATDDAIAKNYRARVFTDGKCYYYKEIDQSGVFGADAGTYFGVVRNHVYRLTLESVKGIGTPVFDPKDIIIPQTPSDEDLYFLGAKVHVLPWRLATQGVNFEGQ